MSLIIKGWIYSNGHTEKSYYLMHAKQSVTHLSHIVLKKWKMENRLWESSNNWTLPHLNAQWVSFWSKLIPLHPLCYVCSLMIQEYNRNTYSFHHDRKKSFLILFLFLIFHSNMIYLCFFLLVHSQNIFPDYLGLFKNEFWKIYNFCLAGELESKHMLFWFNFVFLCQHNNHIMFLWCIDKYTNFCEMS